MSHTGRVWVTRSAILLGLALFLAVLYALLPAGVRWSVWILAGLIALAVIVELALRARRGAGEEAQWERWRQAMEDPAARRAAIADVRARIDRARRFGPRMHLEHARLASVLAELSMADGRSQEAIDALAKVPIDAMEPAAATVIRHARAQAYLHAGDVEGAASALAMVKDGVDPVLDASIAIARGFIALGEKRTEDAERIATEVLAIAEEGDELHDEALALRAAIRGERALLDRIDEAGKRRLRLLGPAAIREVLRNS